MTRPPSQADLALLPSMPAGATARTSGPGMRGLTGEERRDGISDSAWSTVLAQIAADGNYEISVRRHVHVPGERMMRHLLASLVDSHWGGGPPHGIDGEAWTASGLAGTRGAGDHHRRVLTWLDDNPDIAEAMRSAHRISADQPGHHVAWAMTRGVIEHDILGLGREGESWTAPQLLCECSATYDVSETGQHTTWGAPGLDPHRCPYRWAAACDAALQTRARLGITAGQLPSPGLMRQLLDAALAGEWIGQPSASSFWGSNLYLQTVAEICEVPMSAMWAAAEEASEAGLVSLDGAVLLPYREPPEPAWETVRTVEGEGVTMAAMLDTASRDLDVRIVNMDTGVTVATARLAHDPVFGLDVEDIEMLDQELAAACRDASSQARPSQQR